MGEYYESYPQKLKFTNVFWGVVANILYSFAMLLQLELLLLQAIQGYQFKVVSFVE